MVCKKEVIAWFRDLSAYRRIDFLCALMDCCSPLELRFLGAYVEELGRKDFDSLRESELNANDISYLTKLTNISDIRILDKVLTSLALMNSKCQDGARVLFRTLKDHTNTILNGGRTCRDPQTQPDTHGKVVLLAVMALNHPAFTFSQKQALRTQLSALLQAVEGQPSDEATLNRSGDDNLEACPVDTDLPLIQLDGEVDVNQCAMVVPLPTSVPSNSSVLVPSNASVLVPSNASVLVPSNTSVTIEPNQTKQESAYVYIKNIEVKGLKKRPVDKRYEYTFQVHWSNGTVSSVSKTHAQLFDFQCKLLNLFPEEGSDQCHDRVIPYLPGKHIFSTAHKGELAEKTLPEIVEYAKQLSALPQHILECEHTVNFFQPPPDPTTGAPLYTTTAQPSQLIQTQAAIMPKQQSESSHQPVMSSGLQASLPNATRLADPPTQLLQPEPNQLQQHVEQVQQLQQHQHIQGGLAVVQQQQQTQHALSLSTSPSQMQISHHHPVSVSTPTPTLPTMSTPVSCIYTSMVTATAVTTTACSGGNAQYYPVVNNMSIPGAQPSVVPSPHSAPTELYNITATGSNDKVPGLQQYKLPGTRLPYKPNSWPVYSQPNMAPPNHTTSQYMLPSPHMCVSGPHSPRYFPVIPHYPPPRDPVVPPVQEWLKKQRLHKYGYLFEGMTIQQVLHLTDDEIDSWNIVTGAKGRIKTQLQALRNGLNGLTSQAIGVVPNNLTGASATIPGGQAYMAQLQTAGLAGSGNAISGMLPGFSGQPLSSGEGTGSECSSSPSSPRESSDENDRDSEGSESSIMSSPEARPILLSKGVPDSKVTQLPTLMDRNVSKRIGQSSPRLPLASLPYMVQSPTGEVIPLALAVGGRAENLMMQPPPPPGRQMDVRLPGMQLTPNGSSSVLEMTLPQQKGGNGVGGSHLSMSTSSTMSMIPRHQAPIMSLSDSNVGMPNMAPTVPIMSSSLPNMVSAVSPVTPPMDLATQMMHMKGPAVKSTLPSPQYTPVEESAYKTNAVPCGVHTSGTVPVLSNSVASLQIANVRTDNAMANHMMNTQGIIDHSAGRTLGYASSTSHSNFVVNPIQAPTAVTYVTTTSQSHTVAMPNNTYDSATNMPFNNNQSAYNPSVSNNSTSCTSCGCNGQCGSTSGTHHGPPHFPPLSGTYLPGQVAFQHNFNPNFYHQGNVGNVLPPTPTNNVMNSPMPAPTGNPANPRYPSPIPPTAFQSAMPGEMPPYGGGNGAFPGLIPHAMYLGAMGMAAAGQRTNHLPSNHQIAQVNVKKPPPITCFNCGARGHRQTECQEATMEAITHNSQYRLNFKPLPEQNDNSDS